MPASLTSTQLYAALAAEHIAVITANPPVIGEEPDVVDEEILAACARVDAYTAGYTLDEALTTAWARDIAAWHLLKRLAIASEDHKAAMERALRELEDVRDGKFKQLAADTLASTGKLSFGSREKIL